MLFNVRLLYLTFMEFIVYSASKKIEGTISYPVSFPSSLPNGSCMIVELKNILKEQSYMITYQVIYNPTKFKDTRYELELPGNDVWQPEHSLGLGLFATVNNGWCANEPQKDKLHIDDFVAKKQYVINTREVINGGEAVFGPTIEIY